MGHAALGMRIKDAVRANQTANDMFDEALATFLGINRTDGRCLDVIDRHGRVSAGQLAIESGLTTGAVTAVVDRLEKAGYVLRIRDALDRRKVWIEPTEEMRALTRYIFGFYIDMSPAFMRRFSREQLSAIVQFLEMGSFLNREMAAALGEHNDPQVTSVANRLDRAKNLARALKGAEGRLLEEVEKLAASVAAAT
jgi:DNA-binding MarR family transcriptional regulator